MSYTVAALFVLTALLVSSPSYAQSQAFVTAGQSLVGDDGAKLSLSAGGEKIGRHGLSAGADALVLFGRTGFRPGFPNGQSYRQYMLSAFAGAHGLGTRLEPFVNGGVSIITDPDCCGPYVVWNVGGGASYWLRQRFGIRADARLALPFSGEGGLILGRVGMVFR
jgi:hypothetical protein